MNTLRQVLNKILKSSPGLKQGLKDARMIEAWAPAVGETISKHTRAKLVRNKTMIIDVDHPVWKQELLANKHLALKKLNEKISEMMGEEPKKTIWIEDLYFGNMSSAKKKPSEVTPKQKEPK
jgi:predicted nucleic acid-binding Zn ribbon protein